MRIYRSLVLAAVAGCLVALPAVSEAQARGRAVPRGSVRVARPPMAARSYRPVVRPRAGVGFYYGYPWYVGPSMYGGFGYGGWGYPYSSWYGGYPGFGYGSVTGFYGGVPGFYGGAAGAYGAYGAYGGVRIAVSQRDAEVYVDGYYAGVVDNFDGNLQQVNLEPGPHHLEVRADGFEAAQFDVNVQPGRTVTYRTALRPVGP